MGGKKTLSRHQLLEHSALPAPTSPAMAAEPPIAVRKLRSYAELGHKEMQCWSQQTIGMDTIGVGAIIGIWKKEEFERVVKGRVYVSTHTPYKPNGQRWPTTHNGSYLQISLGGGKKLYFHSQLWKDYNPGWRPRFNELHVHHLPKVGVHKKDWPLDNNLRNLQGMEGRDHLAEHAAEGGRPPKNGSLKVQWSAAKRR